MAPDPGPAGSARDGRDPRARAPSRIRARAGILGARGCASSRSSGLATLAAGTLPGVTRRARRADQARSGRGGLKGERQAGSPAQTGPRRLSRREGWWAGAESNRHSRRRGFYRPLGSPPARPTHDGDHADADRGTRRLGAAAILPDSGMVRRVRSETGPSLTGLLATIICKRGISLPHPRNSHPTLMSAAEHAVLRSFAARAFKGKST